MSTDATTFLIKLLSGQIPRLPRHVMDDLRMIGETPIEEVHRISNALAQERGIPSDSRLTEIVNEYSSENRRSTAIRRALIGISPDRVDRVLRELRAWGEENPLPEDRLTPEQLDAIQERVKRLIQPHSALVKYWMSEQHRSLTGKRVESLDLVCDLRPMFDASQTSVEGLLPLITFRMTFENDEEPSSTLDVQFSETDLEELAEKVAQVQQQLKALRVIVQQWVPPSFAKPE